MNYNNIWETAEAYHKGTLSPAEKAAIDAKITTDPIFADEFQESLDLIASLVNTGKHLRFKETLKDIHQKQFKKRKSITIQLPPNFFRTAAIAAGVALIFSLINYLSLVNSNGKRNEEYSTISREVEHIKKDVQKQKEQQEAILDSINKKDIIIAPPSEVRYTGTGFALTNDGYFVTAYHVLNDGSGDCDSVYIQSSEGQYYKATVVNVNKNADIAILKVSRRNFKFTPANDLPYTFAGDKAGLGAGIFTLGYPKNDIVYSEGYISSRNGYDGNKQQYTLELPVGHGQSGSPVLDEKGNVIGILTAIGSPKQANTYAVSTKALMELVATIPNYKSIRLPKSAKLSRLNRQQQIAQMENFTFSVKVYKK